MQLLMMLVLGAALCACANPEGKFNDFVKRDEAMRNRDAGMEDAGGPSGEAGMIELPTPAQVEGTFLLSVSTTLGPTTPILDLVEAKATVGTDGLDLELRYRALSYTDRKTPVEPFTDWKKASINAAGQFVFADRITTPGAGNAVRPDTMTVADLVFSGRLADAMFDSTPERLLQFWCGKVDGTLIEPVMGISFKGSTFAWSRVVDPNNLPAVVLNCAMDPAEPLK